MNIMIIVTPEEISQYRSELADTPTAQRTLDMIEDCEGNIEDAAIALALQAGQEPDESERWLESVAKRWRSFLCQPSTRDDLTAGLLSQVVQALLTETTLPDVLAVPIAIYVSKTGVEEFCQPLQEKIR